MPAITTGPTDVYLPRSSALIVFLIAILVFHGFNGVRLLAAELFGVGIANARRVFYGTLAAAMALIVLSGVLI